MGEPKAGEVIGGRYVLELLLGKGGFGSVWRARDRVPPERTIALKILHVELARNPRMAERFAREAMVLATLDHPCIARSLDFGTSAMPPYIAMELVRGRTLFLEIHEHATRGTSFSEREILERARLIAGAIDHAHEKGVIHRDLKPGNVIVDAGGSVLALKVLDFGVAKIVGQSGEATTAGRILGSLHYLAPEHIRGEELDPRADVFSLGTLLFELLTLRRVWTRDWEDRPLLAGKTSKELEALNATPAVMQRIMSGLRPRAVLFREGLHPAVDEVFARALAIDREARFSRAGELVRALEAAFHGEVVAPLPASIALAAAPTTGLPLPVQELAPIQEPTLQATAPTFLLPAAPPAPAPPPEPGVAARILIAAAIIVPIIAIVSVLLMLREDRVIPLPPPPELAHVEPEAIPQPSARAIPKVEAPIKVAPQKARPRTQPIEEPKSSPPPETKPAPPAYPELRALLQALEEKPNDPAIAEELSKKIAKAADRLQDADRRTSIKRCAAGALFPLDAKELERCYRELVAAR